MIIQSHGPGSTTAPPDTVVITSTFSTPSGDTASSGSSAPTTSSTKAPVQPSNKGSSNGGLSAPGKTAIAVVIPIVVIALLVVAGLFLWRRRKQRKSEEEQRKNEMEEYGYNPNHDPTLPAVAATDEIAEDTSGYRGWGVATAGTGLAGRKTSTTMSGGGGGGMTQVSDGGYQSPNSPTQISDQNSGDPLMGYRNGTMDSETVGALGAVPVAANNRNNDIRRGPSNASSSYSAGDHHSNNSAEGPIPVNGAQDHYPETVYYQPGPYENPYGNMGGPQPIIQDNPARRNTRIQQAPYPHQGTSGISQNF